MNNLEQRSTEAWVNPTEVEFQQDLDPNLGWTIADVAPKISPETADYLSNRYAETFRNEGLTKEQANGEIMAGSEDRMRAKYAAIQEGRRRTETLQKASRMLQEAREGTRVLSPQEQEEVASAVKSGASSPIPESYPEEAYARMVLETSSELDDPELSDQLSTIKKAQAHYMAVETGKNVEWNGQTITPDDGARLQEAHRFIANREVVTNRVKKFLDAYDEEVNWPEAIAGHALRAIPGYSYLKEVDRVAEVEGILPGTNKKAQYEYLMSLPPDQVGNVLQKALDELAANNPVDAKIFAMDMLNYTSSAEMLDNVLFLGLDVGLTAYGGASGIKNIIKAAGKRGSIPGIIEASGDMASAGLLDALNTARTNAKIATGKDNTFDELAGILQPIVNPEAFVRDATSTRFSAGFANKLTDLSNNIAAGIINIVQKAGLSPTRNDIGKEAWQVGVREAVDQIARLYPSTNSRIMAVIPENSADNVLTNTDRVSVLIGDKGALPFDSYKKARNSANAMKLNDAEIIPLSLDTFAIKLGNNVDETLPSVRNALARQIADDPTPKALFGWFRSADEISTTSMDIERMAASQSASTIGEFYDGIVAEAMRPLRRGEKKKLEQFFISERDKVLATLGTQNLYNPINSIGKFERAWMTKFNEMPSEKVVEAYYARTQAEVGALYVNNLGITTRKQRMGVKYFAFPLKGSSLPRASLTPNIEGREIAQIPWHLNDDAGILVLPDRVGGNSGATYVRKKFSSKTTKKNVPEDEMVNDNPTALGRDALDLMVKENGYKVIQLSRESVDDFVEYLKSAGLKAPKGLKDWKGDITYVIVKDVKTSGIGLRHLPYVPGGRIMYEDSFFISQPVIRYLNDGGGSKITDYFGDENWFTAGTKAEADQAIKDVNHARELLRSGNTKELKKFLKDNLPMSYREFKAAFVGRNKIFDLDTPFYVRESNKSLAESAGLANIKESGQLKYPEFTDTRNNTHNIWNDDETLRFAAKKGTRLSRIEKSGSTTSPHLKLVDSPILDPYEALIRSNKTVVHGRYMDDYRTKAAERFVLEYGHLLKDQTGDHVMYPLRALAKGELKNTAADAKELAAARNYQRATKEFLSLENKDLIDWNRWNEKVMNFVGVDAFRKQRKITGSSIEDMMKFVSTSDPITFTRYWAGFIPRMGFFRPKQLFLQAQGVAITAALEGAPRALSAMNAAWYMRPLLLNGDESVVRGLAKQAKLADPAWTEENFIESYKALMKSGFWKVGGEYGDANAIMLGPSQARSIADKSLLFFRMGERANRLTAWNAAYLRWKAANPAKKFDDIAAKEVLNRADTLSLSMTRKSNAAWQNNRITSIPTQFWSAQARLWDLTWGKKLTVKERARLIGYQSVLYGIPSGTFAAGFPLVKWRNEFREELIEDGVDINDNAALKVATDGVLQSLVYYTLGTDQDISENYGFSGFSIIEDLMGENNKSAMEIIGGASGTTLKNLWDAGEHVSTGMSAIYNGDWKIAKEEFIPVLKNISTASDIAKAHAAVQYGKYYDKHGRTILDDVDNSDAVFNILFGTQNQKVADYYEMLDVDRARKEIQSPAKEGFLKYMRLAAEPNVSDEDVIKYQTQAAAYLELGDFTPGQKAALWRELGKNSGSLYRDLDDRIKSGTGTKYQEMLEQRFLFESIED